MKVSQKTSGKILYDAKAVLRMEMHRKEHSMAALPNNDVVVARAMGTIDRKKNVDNSHNYEGEALQNAYLAGWFELDEALTAGV